jgi:hypothetical protein
MDAAARQTGTVYSAACGEVAVVPDMLVYKAWEHLGRTPLRSAVVRHFYYDGVSPPSDDDDEASMWEVPTFDRNSPSLVLPPCAYQPWSLIHVW